MNVLLFWYCFIPPCNIHMQRTQIFFLIINLFESSGDWTCNDCGELNFARRHDCHKCGSPKNANRNGKPTDGWVCPKCGASNRAPQRDCHKCSKNGNNGSGGRGGGSHHNGPRGGGRNFGGANYHDPELSGDVAKLISILVTSKSNPDQVCMSSWNKFGKILFLF